jgi:hypothetical protein
MWSTRVCRSVRQLTVRGYMVGIVLGSVFAFITMRFSLGSGGFVPTFNMPTGPVAAVIVAGTGVL